MTGRGRGREASGAAAASGAETATGLSPRAAATLAYGAWWMTGALFLLLEPTHPFVRFHARQALVGFGVLWAAGLLSWMLAFVALFFSPVVFRGLILFALFTWGLTTVLWVVCLAQAWRGKEWALPGLGRLRSASLGRLRQGPGPSCT